MQNQKSDKFKYLERSKYRLKKSSSTSNLQRTLSKEKSIGQSMFVLDTNKSSIVDVFNILDQDKIKPHSTSTFTTYNPYKYYSNTIQQALNRKFSSNQEIKNNNPQNNKKALHNKVKQSPLRKSVSAKIQFIPEQQPSIQIYKQQHNPTIKNQKVLQPWPSVSQSQNDAQPKYLQCQTCNRTFIEPSYKKHVLICQKVFFKKRPVFNSRGNSRQKSQNKTNGC